MSTPDPGVGNERTALAWQRTALALVAGSAILTRLTIDRLGAAALVSVLLAGPMGLWIFVESRRRYAHDAGIRQRPRSRGGRGPLTMTVGTVVVGSTELLALLVA